MKKNILQMMILIFRESFQFIFFQEKFVPRKELFFLLFNLKIKYLDADLNFMNGKKKKIVAIKFHLTEVAMNCLTLYFTLNRKINKKIFSGLFLFFLKVKTLIKFYIVIVAFVLK